MLCYHRIGGPLELGVTRVSAGVFRKQMEALACAGWTTLPLSEFAAANPQSAIRNPQSTFPNPQSAIRNPQSFLLSFDDAYASLAEHAYPVLADLGFTATTFVITDYVGRTNDWDVPYALRRLPHLDWDAIERWRARGFDFQSHSARHARLTWLEDGELRDDLERSRHAMTRRLGPEAGRAVAYPFGAVDDRVASAAAAAGYEMGFGTGNAERGTRNSSTEIQSPVPRSALPVPRLMRLPRTPVYVWDRFAVPVGLRDDVLGRLGRGAAGLANRCAVGTSALLGLWRAGLGLLRAAPQRSGQEDRAG